MASGKIARVTTGPRQGDLSLQTDPIGYDDGLNWYAYVGNDPMNRSDPTGTTIANECYCSVYVASDSGSSGGGPTGPIQVAGKAIVAGAKDLYGSAKRLATDPKKASFGDVLNLVLAAIPLPGGPAVKAEGSAGERIIAETLAGRGSMTSGTALTATELINAGLKFLGADYTEIGSGVYRSANGTRQFRIDTNSIAGRHAPNVPHGHFEVYEPGARKPTVNNHVPFIDD